MGDQGTWARRLVDVAFVTTAFAVPIFAVDRRLIVMERRTISNVWWTALDDPHVSWWPVGTWTTLSAHMILKRNWRDSICIGMFSGAVSFGVLRFLNRASDWSARGAGLP